MLRFAEEVLLLLLDEERGDITTRISTHTLNVVLSGAVLMDLALEGHIDTDPRQLVVTDPTPTGDSLLDFALNDMMLDTEIHDAGYWIRHFARQGNAIRRRVLRRLVKRNVLESETEGRILLSRLVSLSRRYPMADGSWVEEVRLRIMRILFSDEIPAPRDVAIICLADSCNLFEIILNPTDLYNLRDRIDLVNKMDLIGRSVSTSLRKEASAGST